MMGGPVRAGVVVPIAAVLFVMGAPPALADWTDALPAVSADTLRDSVRDIELDVRDIKLDVRDFKVPRTDGAASVLDVSTDMLFEFAKADVRTGGDAAVRELIAKVPQGAKVQVYGHTDGIGTDAVNQPLSEARAEAVAAIIRADRPDLQLDVQGFGKLKPLAKEGGDDDEEARAQNRRVEIRYAG